MNEVTPSAESDAEPLDYLRQLQAEAVRGFHRGLRAWVDDESSVARALTTYATRPTTQGEAEPVFTEGGNDAA